ncbi:hypothetical protein [Streptomyces pactum]|uniref:Uncharacterized protein n=1 Tax=Streptomyces pactum TaxID=68249 RepID=A0A1S6J3E7_9ACTN|nr:hypothetical protein [Streptomyces pactum]AQS66280.1 hypothetical protein B1H29_04470 [Streptomyces pactum]
MAEIWEREPRTAYALAHNEAVPARQQPPTASAGNGAAPTLNEDQIVARFREHLKLVANGRSVIKWKTLLRKQGMPPSALSARDQVRLLAAVTDPTSPAAACYRPW